ncbi:MAG: DUF169 domain-containing protein [Chloroflexi bacterium]|nr:DUF169 domain-containing protein [Chloroflexota bacterium]
MKTPAGVQRNWWRPQSQSKEKQMEQLTGTSKTISEYLGMTMRPVGVKLYKQGDTVDAGAFDKPEKRMTFCRFVREAAKGKNYLMRLENLDCANAEVSLGFREPKYVKIEPRIAADTGALRIGPVDGADVVMLVLNAEQVMTLSILLDGVKAEFKGNMAVCGEAMAQVYNTGKPNVTVLCNGARTFGTYETNEIIMALPARTFEDLPSKMGKFSSLSKKAKDGLAHLLLKIR